VTALARALEHPETRTEAAEAIRGLIDAHLRGMLWPAGATAEADEATMEYERQRSTNDRRVAVLIKGVDLNVPTPRDAKP
jgi:hypothetical protein